MKATITLGLMLLASYVAGCGLLDANPQAEPVPAAEAPAFEYGKSLNLYGSLDMQDVSYDLSVAYDTTERE